MNKQLCFKKCLHAILTFIFHTIMLVYTLSIIIMASFTIFFLHDWKTHNGALHCVKLYFVRYIVVLWFNNPLNKQLVRLRWSLYFFDINQYYYNQHHGKVNMACTTLWWRAQTPTSQFRVWTTVVVLQTFVIPA